VQDFETEEELGTESTTERSAGGLLSAGRSADADDQPLSDEEFEQRLKTIEKASEHLEAKIDQEWEERKNKQEQVLKN
jgi:hypothetical protein